MTPAALRKTGLIKGIHLFWCINPGGKLACNHYAHAHNNPADPFFGWVCVEDPRLVMRPGSRHVSRLIMEEVGHIATPGHGHDDVWRRWMRKRHIQIGPQERKKPRLRQ